MMKSPFIALALASAMSLAACGTTTSDRALSGGALGALGGAAIGSVTGSAGAGAVIGGVAGAAAGALTSPSDVNLGDPVWRKSHHCVERYSNGDCARWAHN